MSEAESKKGSGFGVIRSTRLPNGLVRIELVAARDRAAIELSPEFAKGFALGVLSHVEPLTDTGAAAIAAARAIEGGGNG